MRLLFHQADRALFGLLTKPIQDELGSPTSHRLDQHRAELTLAAMTDAAGSRRPLLAQVDHHRLAGLLSLMTVIWVRREWRYLRHRPAYLTVMFFRSIPRRGESSMPSAMALWRAPQETGSRSRFGAQGVLYFALMTRTHRGAA